MSDGVSRTDFIEFADLLTHKQANAFYRRRIAGESRDEVADVMGTSPSNVDNHERAAHAKIIKAYNLTSMLEGCEGFEYDGELGVCAECNSPTHSMYPDPDDDRPIEDKRMLCADCADAPEEERLRF